MRTQRRTEAEEVHHFDGGHEELEALTVSTEYLPKPGPHIKGSSCHGGTYKASNYQYQLREKISKHFIFCCLKSTLVHNAKQ